MSKKLFSWLGLALLTVGLSFTIRLNAIADTPKHYTELEFEPLSEIQLPEYDRYQLDNGMVVYLLEDRDFPLISGTAIIRTGSRFEPANKVGLAQLTGTVMRSGGTQNHPAADLNLILEQKAASVETGISNSSGSASFNTLTEDLDTVFPLFTEVLRQPAFAPEQFAIALKEYDTLDNISLQDVNNFYQTYVRPDNIILGIVGDFDTDAMMERVKTAFGNWQAGTSLTAFTPPTTRQKYDQGIFIIDRPQQTQSNILLGHIGGQFDNPDYPTLSVLNGVLNGFGGRLFNEVRSRQGLAYSVYGSWSPSYDFDGMFIAGGQTQTSNTVPFIKSVVKEIKKLRQNVVSEQELTNAKESILNSFVFNFQNPSQTLSRLMRYEYFDYPENFIFEYQKQVEETTQKDILEAAQEYLQPEQLVTVVVGNVQEINPPLSSLEQEINLVDVAIPQTGKS